MDPDWKRLTDFLIGEGIDKVGHTGKTYLAHLIALYKFMEARGCNRELCRAGMFHSIYGTEKFQGFKLPLERRPEVRTLIGERAERLAYLNCAMDRTAFDRAVALGELVFTDRLTRQTFALSPTDFDDLCRIHLYDWLEQVPRAQNWDYRRDGYRRMARRLGGVAQESYDSVFSQEPVSAKD
jgi:hypothetical protein